MGLEIGRTQAAVAGVTQDRTPQPKAGGEAVLHTTVRQAGACLSAYATLHPATPGGATITAVLSERVTDTAGNRTTTKMALSVKADGKPATDGQIRLLRDALDRSRLPDSSVEQSGIAMMIQLIDHRLATGDHAAVAPNGKATRHLGLISD